MKVILTGATGFIGNEVLRQLLQNPKISLITVITRRPLPDELGSPKIRQVICKEEFEWLEWGPSMMRWVDDSEACIWYALEISLLQLAVSDVKVLILLYTLGASEASPSPHLPLPPTLPRLPLCRFPRPAHSPRLRLSSGNSASSTCRPTTPT